jgi:hypothetical protein
VGCFIRPSRFMLVQDQTGNALRCQDPHFCCRNVPNLIGHDQRESSAARIVQFKGRPRIAVASEISPALKYNQQVTGSNPVAGSARSAFTLKSFHT